MLVVSALEQRGVLKEAFKAGAADFVSKPFDKENLQATLAQLVSRKQHVRSAAHPGRSHEG